MGFSNASLLLLFAIGVSESKPQQIDVQSRIVGGSTAQDGDFPYQVSLRNPAHNAHFCGGSIISPNWILTAAHCVSGMGPSSIFVVVGTNSLSSGGIGYGVSEIRSHVSYNPINNVNDIAVLRINGVISYGPKVQSVGLAALPVLGGTSLTLSGWGLTSYPSSILPNDLQQISLKSITTAQCQNALPGYPVYDTNVCTYDGVGRGSCQGDSGGPLVVGSQVGPVQVGIVSWGIPCAKGSPDIFTSVASYRTWILLVTGIIL
ncbi:chymotrypsin-2-like [Bradysia coprophila]|uniref:chymotrypsin-2-like n=1 Tax=Bradysia coprophila TaxID=38358 RepID=UPI00187D76B1|nr:chymotrypsin-2-like [Bradysia coprophila]